MNIFLMMRGEVKLFCLRITSQRLPAGIENNSDLSQDNTFRGIEPTVDYQKYFLPVFRSAVRKKLARKPIVAKRGTMFAIAYKLVFASVASEECLRNIGLGNRQLCITAPLMHTRNVCFIHSE